jgi:hypothetical protein
MSASDDAGVSGDPERATSAIPFGAGLSERRALATIAPFAKNLQVTFRIGAPHRKRDHVVKLIPPCFPCSAASALASFLLERSS